MSKMMDKVVVFDLDDTLSKEIRYLESAYKEIASYAVRHCEVDKSLVSIWEQRAYEEMLLAYHAGENAFEILNNYLELSLPIVNYLDIYRNHYPSLQLSFDVLEALTDLAERGCTLGLITDGRSIQQRNKFEALGLGRWIAPDNVIISEEFGQEKPSRANYEYFTERYPYASFVYVGDNPKKDFLAPNQLGWMTVCVLDNGEHIHKQNFSSYGPEYQPMQKILSLRELIYLI